MAGGSIYVLGGMQDALYRPFVRKYDANGTELWTLRPADCSPRDLAADASGVYVVGTTGGALPGQTSAGEVDAVVRKYDVNGTELWTRQFGSPANDSAFGVAVAGGSIYVVGSMRDALSLRFVRKYDANGTELWTLRPADYSPSEPAADASGVYVVGVTDGALPGQTSAGEVDAVVRRYDAGGTELWTRQFGTATYDYPTGAGADASGVYVGGFTEGPGPDEWLFSYAFVAKLAADAIPPPTPTIPTTLNHGHADEHATPHPRPRRRARSRPHPRPRKRRPRPVRPHPARPPRRPPRPRPRRPLPPRPRPADGHHHADSHRDAVGHRDAMPTPGQFRSVSACQSRADTGVKWQSSSTGRGTPGISRPSATPVIRMLRRGTS